MLGVVVRMLPESPNQSCLVPCPWEEPGLHEPLVEGTLSLQGTHLYLGPPLAVGLAVTSSPCQLW